MRRPVLLLVVLATALLLAVPAGADAASPAALTRQPDAAVPPGAAGGTPHTPAAAQGRSDPVALRLVWAAATAARTRGWSGTQSISSWRDGTVRSALVRVEHDPRWGTRVHTTPQEPVAAAVPAAAVDARLLDVLAARYALAVAPVGSCSGRRAEVVEARRAGGSLAARLWLDTASGLALRRDLYDGGGQQVRSSTFVDLAVSEPLPAAGSGGSPGGTAAAGRVVGEDELGRLRAAGWPVPQELAGGALFDARRSGPAGAVLHLAYSDGLSSLSLFAQTGRLGASPPPGYRARGLAGASVFVRPGTPTRAVWSGGGRVFTLVGDADDDELADVVRALPHSRQPAAGVPARLGRGLSRIASWVSPGR